MSIEEKLTKIAEDMPKVYEAGVEQGKQAEYDAFWDIYQDYGNRTLYRIYEGSFAGQYWTDMLFRPKYSISPTSAAQMFRGTAITDLTREGILLDFSRCTELQYAFAYSSYLKKLPLIDMSSATNCESTYTNFKGTDLSVVVSEKTGLNSSTFAGLDNLVNLSINGIIGKAGVDFHWSTKLNKASHESIINALSTTTTGLTATFSKKAVNNAFATTEGGTDGSTSAEWLALVATRSNWTISLA